MLLNTSAIPIPIFLAIISAVFSEPSLSKPNLLYPVVLVAASIYF